MGVDRPDGHAGVWGARAARTASGANRTPQPPLALESEAGSACQETAPHGGAACPPPYPTHGTHRNRFNTVKLTDVRRGCMPDTPKRRGKGFVHLGAVFVDGPEGFTGPPASFVTRPFAGHSRASSILRAMLWGGPFVGRVPTIGYDRSHSCSLGYGINPLPEIVDTEPQS